MKGYFIYCGRSESGDYRYFKLMDLSLNDGRSISSIDKGYYSIFKKAIRSKNKSIGGVFEVEFEECLSKFSHKKVQLPIDFWKCEEDRRSWYVTNRVVELQLQDTSEIKKNVLKEQVEPIREIYKNSNYNLRSLILAEVIRLITNI